MARSTFFTRAPKLAATAIFVCLSLSQAAQAASCKAMVNELRQLDRADARSTKYQRAVAQQQAALRKVERALRQNGCSSRSSNVCNQYVGAQRKMNANIRALQSKAGGANSARKASLTRALDRNCRARSASRAEPKRVGFFEALRGMGSSKDPRREVETASVVSAQRTRQARSPQVSSARSEGRRSSGTSVGGGSYRAVCVRMGDGYYWPAGETIERGDFSRVEAECVSSCPGQDVKLFVHRVNSETDAMVAAADGSPYSSIPSAHAYRTAYREEFQCGRGVETKIIASPPALPRSLRLARLEASGRAPLEVLPMARPAFDGNGALVVAKFEVEIDDASPTPETRGSARIRVVGPKFLSDRLAGSIAPDRGRQAVPSAPAEGA